MELQVLHDLLKPISDAQPCGADLSFSIEFDRIQEARREDDVNSDYGEWQTSLKLADWPAVGELCLELLRTRTKDIRLAAWLAEAWTNMRAYAGLSDGLQLLSALLRQYGASLQPWQSLGNPDACIQSLTWLAERLVHRLQTFPLVALHEKRRDTTENGTTGHSELPAETVSRLPDTWASQARNAIDETMTALQALQSECNSLFGMEGPVLSTLAETLDVVADRVEMLCRQRGLTCSAIELQAETGVDDIEERRQAMQLENSAISKDDFPQSSLRAGTVDNRAQALASLTHISAYFRAAEPHSPVSYLLDKAVRWGNLRLDQWLRDVVRDQATLSHLAELLGVDPNGKPFGDD